MLMKAARSSKRQARRRPRPQLNQRKSGRHLRLSVKLFDHPGGKIALGLLGCPKWGQLSDFHGLNGRPNSTPAAANPYVFSQLFSKFNHSAIRDFRGTSNDDFDLTTCRRFSRQQGRTHASEPCCEQVIIKSDQAVIVILRRHTDSSHKSVRAKAWVGRSKRIIQVGLGLAIASSNPCTHETAK